MKHKDPLEEQLGMLFSDAVLPPEMQDARGEFESSTPSWGSAVAPRVRVSGWRARLERWIKPLSTLGLLGWLLVVALLLSERMGIGLTAALEEGTSTSTAERQSVVVITSPPAPTRARQGDFSAALEMTDLHSTLTLSPPVASATPTPMVEDATDATRNSIRASATSTALPPTETATVPPTETATASPTPTLAQVRHVFRLTATPAPAAALGLTSIPTPVALVSMPEQAINIALLGSDQRPHETQWRTDVVIIVSIDPEVPSASMLSIPRDTWLYIPNWTYQRINLADTHGAAVGYPGGGPGLVKATIEYNFGIHVDYYARVNFAGLMRIVDTLGGIDVLLDCPVEDGFPDDPITEDPTVVTQISYTEPGLYHVDGKHALWLSRSRKTTSEFARSRRQHRVLFGIWNKARQGGFIARLPELWDELTETVETDLTLEQVLWLASVGLQLDRSQIRSGFIDGRHLTAWVSPGGANVLLPHTEAILKDIESLFNPYPYQAPQRFSQVEVWNGSGHENWGLLAADKLGRYGFDVPLIRKADKLYQETVLMDFTGIQKGSPVAMLERLFNANVARASAEAGAGDKYPLRLIVGADYQPCEWPTPAQWVPTPTPTGGE